MYDFHLHSDFSHDSEEKAENYLIAARALGVKHIGFSEHYDYDRHIDKTEREAPALFDFGAYSASAASLRKKYPEITISKGVELGWSKAAERHYKEIIDGKDLDYAILSVHAVDGRGDCYFPRFYEGLSREEAYFEYLKAVKESVFSDLDYQIIGHLGYISRYSPYENKKLLYSDFPELLDEILKEVIRRGKCLEINTSVKVGNFATDESILKRYIALGGRDFTFGSDSHSAIRLCDGYEKAASFLKVNGINHFCRFENKVKIKEDL